MARRLFATGLERRTDVEKALSRVVDEIESLGREPSVPFRPEVFPFFVKCLGREPRPETVLPRQGVRPVRTSGDPY